MPTATFSAFLSFPPEIHDLIISCCSANDQTCLRLTCKYLYNLFNTPKEALSLAYSDADGLCQSSGQAPVEPVGNWYNVFTHRQHCHGLCYAEAIKRAEREGRPQPRARQKCSTHRWAQHCQCFAGKFKLHQRLRGWMPRGMNYCGQCERFTKRKPQHKGRCYHGRPKPRKSRPNFWTYYSHRGGFGQYRTKMWKKWFNNRAMNHFEERLGWGASPGSRTDVGGRYEFRELAPKVVNTRKMRY